jgi:inorganic pyrophosphatase
LESTVPVTVQHLDILTQKIFFRVTLISFFFFSDQGLFLKGETDWKVIAIDVNDPLAENLNDIHDVEKLMPGFLKVTFYPVYVVSS